VRRLLVLGGHQVDVGHHRVEQLAHHPARLVRHAQDAEVPVQVVPKIAFELEMFLAHGVAEAHQRRGQRSHGIDIRRRRDSDGVAGRIDQVIDDVVDHASHDLVDQPARRQVRITCGNRIVLAAEDRDFLELVEPEQAGAKSVVDVVVVVGDLVGEIRELSLESGLASFEETAPHLAQRARVRRRAVLEDSLARLERQIQTRKLGISFLELVYHAQGLEVVLETAELAHAFVQRVLARVTEWRVPEIVRKADGLGQRLVQAQRARHAAGDLRDLQRVREPRAVQVTLVVDEHLRLVDQAPESGRMHDAIAVALELAAVARGSLLVASAARALLVLRIGRQAGVRVAHAAPASKCSRRVSPSASGS